MKYIVNVSGGLTSFEPLRRTIERYGIEHTHPVVADTLAEDSDLYRFQNWQGRYFGVMFYRMVEGRTWEMTRTCVWCNAPEPAPKGEGHRRREFCTNTCKQKPSTLARNF